MEIFISLIFTVIVYLCFPVLFILFNGKVCVTKGKKFALWNSIICAAIFLFGGIIIGKEPNMNGTMFAPAFFYYYIAKAIMIDKSLTDIEAKRKKANKEKKRKQRILKKQEIDKQKSIIEYNKLHNVKNSDETIRYLNNNKIKKIFISAIIISSLCIISIIIFSFIISNKIKTEFADKKENATTISVVGSSAFVYGSINKNYDIFLLEGEKEFFLFQVIGKEKISVYKVNFSYNKSITKSYILDYFMSVKEENIPSKFLIRKTLTINHIINSLLIISSTILWTIYIIYTHKNKGELNECKS